MPWNEPVTVGGAPRSSRAFSTAWVAWPRETPGARLNDRVAAGNWLWWLIDSELRALGFTLTSSDSGTGFWVSGEIR